VKKKDSTPQNVKIIDAAQQQSNCQKTVSPTSVYYIKTQMLACRRPQPHGKGREGASLTVCASPKVWAKHRVQGARAFGMVETQRTKGPPETQKPDAQKIMPGCSARLIV
jgi:hypothetical protein